MAGSSLFVLGAITSADKPMRDHPGTQGCTCCLYMLHEPRTQLELLRANVHGHARC